MAASTTSTVIKEPTFEVSDFGSPKELENADMWIRLICELVFLEKGTYSDEPDAGVHISTYKFSELTTGTAELENEIRKQCSIYLADIPIGMMKVTSFYWEERNIYILRILVGFKEGTVLTYRTIDISEGDQILTYIISKYDEK